MARLLIYLIYVGMLGIGLVSSTALAQVNTACREIIPEGMITHQVVRGDILIIIAERYSVSVEELVQANGIPDKDKIFPGQCLLIPIVEVPVATSEVAADATSDVTPEITMQVKPWTTPEITPEIVTATSEPTLTLAAPTPVSCITPLPPPVDITPLPTEIGTLLFDDFSPRKNVNVWPLVNQANPPDQTGQPILLNGELVLVSSDKLSIEILPDLAASEFYLEADIHIEKASEGMTNAVLAFGDFSESYNYITFNSERIDVYQFANQRERFILSAQSRADLNCTQHIALSFSNQQVDVYMGTDLATIIQLQALGEQIGLGIQYFGDTGQGTVYFDNLTVMPSRPVPVG